MEGIKLGKKCNEMKIHHFSFNKSAQSETLIKLKGLYLLYTIYVINNKINKINNLKELFFNF